MDKQWLRILPEPQNRRREKGRWAAGRPATMLSWHDPKRQRGRAWIPMWYGPDIPTLPQPGDRYDLLDLGLFKAPRWHPS